MGISRSGGLDPAAIIIPGAAGRAFADDALAPLPSRFFLQAAKDVFGPSAATLVTVPENQIDAVTAVSGSGPAFVFRFVEQMIEAAKEQGIEEETARKLVLGTMKGSVEMLEQAHPLTPGELTDRVCSKGGTTLAGLEKLVRPQSAPCRGTRRSPLTHFGRASPPDRSG